jgi:hypothetical protein
MAVKRNNYLFPGGDAKNAVDHPITQSMANNEKGFVRCGLNICLGTCADREYANRSYHSDRAADGYATVGLNGEVYRELQWNLTWLITGADAHRCVRTCRDQQAERQSDRRGSKEAALLPHGLWLHDPTNLESTAGSYYYSRWHTQRQGSDPPLELT